MIGYKVLILSHKIEKWEDSICSVNALSYNCFLELKKRHNMETLYYDISEDNLPQVDFIILIMYYGDDRNNAEWFNNLREKTKCKKIITLRECLFELSDFSFIFNSFFLKREKTLLLNPPYNKDILFKTEKEVNSILIDHYWEDFLGTENDWTFRIEEWLEDLKDSYKIYRLIKYSSEKETLKNFEIPLYHDNYLNFLDKTKFIENFIVTHKEGFPYGVIDFAVRGAKVLVPNNNFVPECIIDKLNLSVFNDKNSLQLSLKNKIENYTCINNCIDFKEIINIIENKFLEWLSNTSTIYGRGLCGDM